MKGNDSVVYEMVLKVNIAGLQWPVSERVRRALHVHIGLSMANKTYSLETVAT